jgi:hypothetical protein
MRREFWQLFTIWKKKELSHSQMKDEVFYIIEVDSKGYQFLRDPMECYSTEEEAEEAAKAKGLDKYHIMPFDVS